MKFKLFLFACTFSVSTLSFSAFSEESKVCTKTLKTICNESKGQRSRSENYLNEFRRELAKETNKNKSHKTNLKIQSAKSIINEMYGLISKPENVSMFKNYMYQAIDESHFDESIRSKFKKTIESVIIGNFSDFFENNEDKYKQLKAGGAISCGVNAMDINAFSTIIFNQKYVFFCHGFLIELSQLASEEERLSAILQMMSHELAHHIDIKLLGEEIYMPYLSCLSENYSSQFEKTNKDKEFCKKKAKDQAECNMQITRSHAKELIADQWAIKVLAIHARTQRYSLEQADLFLRSNFVNLCETKTEGIHPTGDFRIETLLRINPETSDYLSCNNSKIKKPACTFEGAINL